MGSQREDRRVSMSKFFLKQALINLLTDKGISQITVKELCQLADVNRSTFYAHYKDIYHLQTEVENDIIEQLKQSLQAYIDQEEDQMSMTEQLIEFIGKNHEACQALLGPHSQSSFELKIRHVAHQFLVKDWAQVAQIDESAFPYISAFIISGSIEVVKKWLEHGRQESAKEIAHLIIQLANRGMFI